MREYLQAFLQAFEYPQECVVSLLSDYEKVQTNAEFSLLVSEYGEKGTACDFDNALRALPSIAEQAGIHSCSAVMLYYLCLTKRWKELCLQKGIDETVWENTAKDLRYKVLECKAIYGIWGTFVGSWFIRFFRLERFALGRLQFEWERLGFSYSKNGVELSADEWVLNVHIPGAGTPLTRDSVEAAYAAAIPFFAKHFGLQIRAFVCSSWLLFPRHTQMLKKGSNILGFMADYDLVKVGEYADYTELWRLFDCKVQGEPIDSLPCDSSLRRAYIALMKRGENTGYGKGIYVSKQ